MWAYLIAQKPHILGVVVCENTTLTSSTIHWPVQHSLSPGTSRNLYVAIISKGKLMLQTLDINVYNCIFYP